MVVVRVRLALLLSLVFVASAFAGCLGDDAPAPTEEAPGPSPTPTASGATNTSKPKDAPLVKVDKDSAIFAPTWRQGMTWTYAVAGNLFPTEYETKVGVVSVEDDHYAMAADAVEELQNHAHSDGGVLLGGVQKDSLAISHGDAYQDLFGFRRPAGEEWKVTLYDTVFTLTKPEPTEVEHALGATRGLAVTGPSGKGGSISIVYATDVGGLAHLLWTDAEGETVLEYTLTEHAASGDVSGLKQWTVLDKDTGSASGPPNNAGAAQWTSDGAGSLVFLRVHLRPTSASGAAVITPSGTVTVVTGEGPEEDTLWDGTMPDEEGPWSMVLWNDSGALAGGPPARSDVFLYQIQETVY